ncbi:MAG: exodeoxyribonuclease VII large subunit [Lachnospiraceae bacterium]|nr:exodeoxyribonuclease VII large subunit [Lachnospiraceae bacterium]
MNKNIYSVGQVNQYIKNMFAQDFMLRNICVKGEVSNCKYHSSGHVYFTLKDEKGAISAVMFAGYRKTGLGFPMKEGDKVMVTGSIEVYEKTGDYQIYAKQIEPDGEGNLFLKFEALKQELMEMGMFDSSYKQPIPKYIRRLGVVTAPTGAAIQDIRNITSRRNPYVQVILYPALVQGEGAAQSIVDGIRFLDTYGVDTIIVGRGGGSIEDLWAFNEEIVARAIFDCNTPIISAVGHETDWTIADYVSDMRAPTPSAAAELAVFDYRDVADYLAQQKLRMNRLIRQKIDWNRMRLQRQSDRLKLLGPTYKMNENRRRVADYENRLRSSMEQKMVTARHRLALLAERLDGHSPMRKLSQGFALVEDSEHHTVHSVEAFHEADDILLHLKDGDITAKVTAVQKIDRG